MSGADLAAAEAMSVHRSGLTEQVAAFVADPDGIIPEETLDTARCSLFDWFAVLHAGATEPVGDVVRALTVHERSEGKSLAMGLPGAWSARAAAYVNGAVSHALDYDDTHFDMLGHPTVAVLPAVIAVAQERGVSGGDLLRAFAIGAETACRLGKQFGRVHYAAGFHVTATAGIFGATAGVGHLLGLGRERLSHALGFAATRSSGLRSQFGTMGKPLHAGMAAAGGIEAACLAEFGLISRPEGLECVEGFCATHGTAAVGSETGFAPDDAFLFQNVQYKFHACCHGTHGPLEAVLAVRDQIEGQPDTIARVAMSVHPQWENVCCIAEPATALELKFSLATVIALALKGIDTSSPATFTAELCGRRDVRDLARRGSIRFDSEMSDTVTFATIEMADGRQIQTSHDLLRPVAQALVATKLRRKAAALIGQR